MQISDVKQIKELEEGQCPSEMYDYQSDIEI